MQLLTPCLLPIPQGYPVHARIISLELIVRIKSTSSERKLLLHKLMCIVLCAVVIALCRAIRVVCLHDVSMIAIGVEGADQGEEEPSHHQGAPRMSLPHKPSQFVHRGSSPVLILTRKLIIVVRVSAHTSGNSLIYSALNALLGSSFIALRRLYAPYRIWNPIAEIASHKP
jgi:hypothetical protein